MSFSELTKIDFAIGQEPKETLESFYKRQATKPKLLINGTLFATSTGETIMNVTDEGVIKSQLASLKDGGFGILGDKDLYYGQMSDKAWRDYFPAYPLFVKDSKEFLFTNASEINYLARRTAVGFNGTTVYAVLVDSPGLYLEGLQDIILALGCTYALNLDGGGSTRAVYDGVAMVNTLWSRPVDSMIGFYIADKIIYRVQTGAFSSQPNAEAFKLKIRALEDTIGAGYANAYVRFISPYYKVQVGAFSVKTNAERVVADLATKGINSFITT
jgi:hypothetical protein